MKKVYIYPPESNDNDYIRLIRTAITESGYVLISKQNMKKEFKNISVFILNWYEDIGTNNELYHMMKKLVKLAILKINHKKVVWVLHNRIPHDSHSKVTIYFMMILLRISDNIIILSDVTYEVLNTLRRGSYNYEKKVIKVPLPNYTSLYTGAKDGLEIINRKIKFTFIGLIRQYKNVDLLIDVFKELQNEPVSLQITGRCDSLKYKNELLYKLEGVSNIKIDFRFINTQEMTKLISDSDIIIFPFDLRSSLNSSSIMLAFSNKRCVLSPYIGTLQECTRSDCFYTYQYLTLQEHFNCLIESINDIIKDVKENPSVLKQKGIIAYDLIVKDNSINVLSTIYKSFL